MASLQSGHKRHREYQAFWLTPVVFINKNLPSLSVLYPVKKNKSMLEVNMLIPTLERL